MPEAWPNEWLDGRDLWKSDFDSARMARVPHGQPLLDHAGKLRDSGHGRTITYSPKVFLPLTQLCRNVCHYCTFTQPPRTGERCFLAIDTMAEIARRGAAMGCSEALFTLGDRPELRFRAARDELAALGHSTTLSYLAEAARAVVRETGLLPHINAGVMSAAELAALRPVAASMGLMLETMADRLGAHGGPHHGSPDKIPAARLATIDAAGAAGIPFTSGLLIGIGETRLERIEALVALRELHRRHGHIQEVIIQNFVAKPGTRMADHPHAPPEELEWTIAVARLILGPEMSIQAPPNLAPDGVEPLVRAGINDLGGISPLTPDHVNPERPWPNIDALAARMRVMSRVLVPRLTIYPPYIAHAERWADSAMIGPIRALADSAGLARGEAWLPGSSRMPPPPMPPMLSSTPRIDRAFARLERGEPIDETAIVDLFEARDGAFRAVCELADEHRAAQAGGRVGFVVNRNINYTNICRYRCGFCAFSKGKTAETLRGRPYLLSLAEIERRVAEAWDRGATEVCMQGGIHPSYTGDTYLEIVRAARAAAPYMHIHAFSPLEIRQGAETLGIPIAIYLTRLRDAGLGSLPGTAAEILDDDVRRIICPDKLSTAEWIATIEAAHHIGLRTTSTIMFGHVERPVHWARHLLALRAIQERTGGITEFVPLPFVAREAPMFRKGRARSGPTWREAMLMQAVGRLVLGPVIANIQASWVKLGPEGAARALQVGSNDFGGTLMNESITRAAGADHGEELPPAAIERLIRATGRAPWQRTTLYQDAPSERSEAAHSARTLVPIR